MVATAVLVAVSLLICGFMVVDMDNGLKDSGNWRQRLPDLILNTTDGDTITFGGLKGKVVVLDLMATWCTFCRDQVVELKNMKAGFGDAVEIVSVDLDESESIADLRAYKVVTDSDWPYVMDYSNDVEGLFYPESLPVLVLLDKDGRVAGKEHGVTSADKLGDLISPEL
jgi:thiol-disulfide isomerase/thioredoxin